MTSIRQGFVLSVAASVAAAILTSIGSALLHARVRWQLVLAIVALALISGLAVFAVLAWRRQGRLQRHLDRLERAAWPGWMRDIAVAATMAGISVFREGDYVMFENLASERHLLRADPPGEGLGQALERVRALEALAAWGVPVKRNARGEPIPASMVSP
jgi:hypothetical protein